MNEKSLGTMQAELGGYLEHRCILNTNKSNGETNDHVTEMMRVD